MDSVGNEIAREVSLTCVMVGLINAILRVLAFQDNSADAASDMSRMLELADELETYRRMSAARAETVWRRFNADYVVLESASIVRLSSTVVLHIVSEGLPFPGQPLPDAVFCATEVVRRALALHHVCRMLWGSDGMIITRIIGVLSIAALIVPLSDLVLPRASSNVLC
jgi:hypothetical protein